MIEIKDGFLLIVNGSGMEFRKLSLVGARVIDSEFIRIEDCKVINPNKEANHDR